MEVHNNLGNALSATCNWQEAEAEFFSALHLSPSNAVVLGNLADNYFGQRKIREALAADAKAIKADRYNPQRYAEFGRKLAANRPFEQVTVCFEDALLLNPGDITIQVNLAQTLIAEGHGQEASIVCEQALRNAEESGDKQLIQMTASFWNECHLPAQK
jgi:tetratricopeptide (TPR) repeat protein